MASTPSDATSAIAGGFSSKWSSSICKLDEISTTLYDFGTDEVVEKILSH